MTSRVPLIRTTAMPTDTNPYGGVFGGWLMGQMGLACGSFASRHSGGKAILRVDNKPTEVVLPDIPPRDSTRVPLTAHFPGAGMHDISFQLPDDELPGDNRRWAAVPVKVIFTVSGGSPAPP